MILFISDLHLDASRPSTTQAFYQFLDQLIHKKENNQAIEALYILGDFFELWIGDDDDDPFVIDVQKKLKHFTEQGIPVYFMKGNRDFLIGENFATNSGVILLDDPTLLEINEHRILLMHGDTLCTNDIEYQRFRQQSRSQEWMNSVLSQSLEERRAFGKQLRQQSKTMSSRKAEDIMDVSEDAVISAIQEHNATTLIHGHTHRPKRHEMIGIDKERIVLGDWDSHAWCLKFDVNENGKNALALDSWEI
ncbi:MAG: UDP-2,3-diacylglucosamine diphosphatase [Cellvibrionaceae bacterium]